MSSDNVMDVTKMTDARTVLMCARLQLRGGKRHLKQGFTADGITALYDSVLFGMRYYIVRHKRCGSFVENSDPWDGMSLFQALWRTGVFEDPLVFNRFSLLAERALWQGSFSSNPEPILAEVEEMLTKLGVMRAKSREVPSRSS